MPPRQLIAGRFELHAEVAAGGMGRVYRALDCETGQVVAVKLLRGDVDVDAERFVREGAILASLRHPGIVSYVHHGRAEDGSLYLAMEWVDGRTLSHRLERAGLDVRDAVRVAAQAARALGEAHRHGVVHRDLKPSNLLLERDDPGRVRLIDFGVSRRLVESVALTRTGTAMGTPAYMAPEQARGQRDLDGRADLFALGCILYECLTGYPAFSGENPTAVMAKVTLLDPPPIGGACPEAPRALEALVTRLLAKDVDKRPAEADAVADALEALGGLPSGRPRRLTPALSHATLPSAPGHTKDAGYTAFTVLAAPADAPESRLLEELRDELLMHGAALDALRDGTLIAVIAGTDAVDAAARAARTALVLRARLLGEIVLATAGSPNAMDPVAEALDRGARVLSTGALHAVYAGLSGDDAAPAGVRVDSRTAQLLGPRFRVERRDGGSWLLGEA